MKDKESQIVANVRESFLAHRQVAEMLEAETRRFAGFDWSQILNEMPDAPAMEFSSDVVEALDRAAAACEAHATQLRRISEAIRRRTPHRTN